MSTNVGTRKPDKTEKVKGNITMIAIRNEFIEEEEGERQCNLHFFLLKHQSLEVKINFFSSTSSLPLPLSPSVIEHICSLPVSREF